MDLVETTSFMEGLEWLAANEEYVDTRGGYTIAKGSSRGLHGDPLYGFRQ